MAAAMLITRDQARQVHRLARELAEDMWLDEKINLDKLAGSVVSMVFRELGIQVREVR